MESFQPNDQEETPLEISQEQEFVDFFRRLPDKPATTIRIFDRKDFFTIHGDDAIFIAKEIMKTQTIIKYISSHRIPSVLLNINKLEMILKEILLIRHYLVEIYKAAVGKSARSWKLELKASPGHLGELEDLIYSNNSNSYGLAAIIIVGNISPTIGFAYINSIDKCIKVIEFEDNQYLTNFEALLLQCAPKEILVTKSLVNSVFFKRFQEIIELNQILTTETKNASNADFSKLNLMIRDLVNDENGLDYLQERKHSTLALITILDYMDSMKSSYSDTTSGSFSIKILSSTTFLRLDSTALRSLDLFPQNIGQINRINMSIYQLLNHCKTQLGQRLLAQWIRQPLLDINHIEERLDLVQHFYENDYLRRQLYSNHLVKIPDLIRLSKKFEQKKATLSDCCKVYQFLNSLPLFTRTLEENGNVVIKSKFVDILNEYDEIFSNYRQLIESTLDVDDDEQGPTIRTTYDDDFSRVYQELERVNRQAEQIFKSVANRLELEPNKTIKMEKNLNGFVFRITNKEEKFLRDRKDIIFTEKAKKDGIRFVTSKLKELSSEYVGLRANFEEMEKLIFEKVIEIASQYNEPMRKLGDVVANIDVLISLATCAKQSIGEYVRPKLLPKGSGIIKIVQMRHPCLETQPTTQFVPNDIYFDSNKYKQFLITGPNMGGKSTFIRSIGICILLAQMGSFVPADSATISIVDGIYTRVGSSDFQYKGVSTFMAEMIETSSILRSATSDSLVIMDELGRGTSTDQGFALSSSIFEYVVTELKAYCLFATHFHELKELSDKHPSIGNLHVTTATNGTDDISFLYKVEPGFCDKSFGIHIAKLVRFPEHIIQEAEKKVETMEGFHSSLNDMKKYIIENVKNWPDSLEDEELMIKRNELIKECNKKWIF